MSSNSTSDPLTLTVQEPTDGQSSSTSATASRKGKCYSVNVTKRLGTIFDSQQVLWQRYSTPTLLLAKQEGKLSFTMQGGFLTPKERHTVEQIFTNALHSKAAVVEHKELYGEDVSTDTLKRMVCDRFYSRTGCKTFTATNRPTYVTPELWNACRSLSSTKKLKTLGVAKAKRSTVLQLHKVFDQNHDASDYFYHSARSYSQRAHDNAKSHAVSTAVPELLAEEQQRALCVLLESSKHVLLTGGPGCGKVENVCVLANGMTSSLGVNSVPFSAFRAALASSDDTKPSQLLPLLRRIQLLVFDDVQRLSAEQFAVISSVVAFAKRSQSPFGGARVLLCGDLLQVGPGLAELSCVFESELWAELDPTVIYLNSALRYDDEEFAAFLRQLRHGYFHFQHWSRFEVHRESESLASTMGASSLQPEARMRTLNPILVGTYAEMSKKNGDETAALQTEQHTYRATDEGAVDPFEWPVDASLLLKVGMPVMYVGSRKASSIPFGSIGIVTGLESTKAVVRFDEPFGVTPVDQCLFGPFLSVCTRDEVILPTRRQVPLIPAYALTLQKVLGVTLSRGTVAFTKMFSEHQHYSAMVPFMGSTLPSIIDPPSASNIRVNPGCVAFERHCLGRAAAINASTVDSVVTPEHVPSGSVTLLTSGSRPFEPVADGKHSSETRAETPYSPKLATPVSVECDSLAEIEQPQLLSATGSSSSLSLAISSPSSPAEHTATRATAAPPPDMYCPTTNPNARKLCPEAFSFGSRRIRRSISQWLDILAKLAGASSPTTVGSETQITAKECTEFLLSSDAPLPPKLNVIKQTSKRFTSEDKLDGPSVFILSHLSQRQKDCLGAIGCATRVPVEVNADGNCLWRSLSVSLWHSYDEQLWQALKLAVICFMARHREELLAHPFFSEHNVFYLLENVPSEDSGHSMENALQSNAASLDFEIAQLMKRDAWGGLVAIVSAAVLLQVPIVVVYPDVSGCEGSATTSSAIVDEKSFVALPLSHRADAAFSNYIKDFNSETAVCLLYTSTTPEKMNIGPAPSDSSSRGSRKERSTFVPNHFVPLVLPADASLGGSLGRRKRGRG